MLMETTIDVVLKKGKVCDVFLVEAHEHGVGLFNVGVQRIVRLPCM